MRTGAGAARGVATRLVPHGKHDKGFSGLIGEVALRRNFHSTTTALQPASENASTRNFAAALLERYPIIMVEQPEWEREFQDWILIKRNESRKTVPEKLYNSRYQEENTPDFDWTPAPRITQDDISKNMKSLNRAIDQKLYLLVKYKDGGWQFPQILHTEGQTIREAAEAGAGMVASMDDVYVIGNAPSAHLVVPEDESVGGAKTGDKVFYHRMNYLAKSYELPKGMTEATDYVWVTNKEIWGEYFTGAQAELMKLFLMSTPGMDPNWEQHGKEEMELKWAKKNAEKAGVV